MQNIFRTTFRANFIVLWPRHQHQLTTTTATQAVGNHGYASTSESMSCSETGRQTNKTTPNAELRQLHSRYSIVLLFLVLTLTRRGLTLQSEIGFTYNFRLYLLQLAIPWGWLNHYCK